MYPNEMAIQSRQTRVERKVSSWREALGSLSLWYKSHRDGEEADRSADN
jgi:hypothetical protein